MLILVLILPKVTKMVTFCFYILRTKAHIWNNFHTKYIHQMNQSFWQKVSIVSIDYRKLGPSTFIIFYYFGSFKKIGLKSLDCYLLWLTKLSNRNLVISLLCSLNLWIWKKRITLFIKCSEKKTMSKEPIKRI